MNIFPQIQSGFIYVISLTVIFIVSVLAGCSGVSGESTYSLYRNSVMDETARIHVGTFDSSDGDKYNQSNCDIAAKLFQQQVGVKTKFWCEKGKFRH